MGFLDQLGLGGDLGSLTELVGGNDQVLKAAASLLNPSDSSVGGSNGLGELLGSLQSSGLGDQVSSWLGQGSNMGISADQLTGALGGDTMSQFADKAGIDLGQAGAMLAAVLPGLIDKLSPDGAAPEGDALSGLLSKLM